MILFPLRLLWAWLYGLWEGVFNRAVLGAFPPAMMRFKVSGTPSLLTYDLLGRETARFIAPYIVGKVLDYGCGCGRVSRHLGCDGVDLDEAAVVWCASHLKGSYGGCRKDYDTIICISILSHVDMAEAVNILMKIKEQLKSGVRLIVTTHKTQGYRFRKAKVFGSYFSTAGYSEVEFRRFLEDNGFEVEEIVRFDPSPSQMMAVAHV